jgi:hypothetical protein
MDSLNISEGAADGYYAELVLGYIQPGPPAMEPTPAPAPSVAPSPTPSPVASTPVSAPTTTLYREYAAVIAQHLTTAQPGQEQSLLPIFQLDGAQFKVYSSSSVSSFVQIYRCAFNSSGEHFTTTRPSCEGAGGAVLEGPLGWVDSVQQTGEVPLYRLYRPGNGDHMDSLTMSEGASDGYYAELVLGYIQP